MLLLVTDTRWCWPVRQLAHIFPVDPDYSLMVRAGARSVSVTRCWPSVGPGTRARALTHHRWPGPGCPGGSDHEGWEILNNEAQSFYMSDWTSLMIHFCDLLSYAGIWGGGLAGRGQLWHSLTLASLTLLSQILEQSSDVPRPVQWLLLTQRLCRVLS